MWYSPSAGGDPVAIKRSRRVMWTHLLQITDYFNTISETTVAPLNLTQNGVYRCSSRGNTDYNRICICMSALDVTGVWQRSQVTYTMQLIHMQILLQSLCHLLQKELTPCYTKPKLSGATVKLQSLSDITIQENLASNKSATSSLQTSYDLS